MPDAQTIRDAALFGISQAEITRACERFQRRRNRTAADSIVSFQESATPAIG